MEPIILKPIRAIKMNFVSSLNTIAEQFSVSTPHASMPSCSHFCYAAAAVLECLFLLIF